MIFIYSTVLFNTGLSTAICNPTTFPNLDFRQFLPAVGVLPHPGDTLFVSYTFGCEGRITQWEAYTSGEGAHPIEFQVWRARTELFRYDLVGVNTFPNATPTDNILRLSVPEGEQINVSPGDFVGISTTAGTEGDGFKIQTITGTQIGPLIGGSIGNIIRYNLTERGYDETPDQLLLRTLVGDPTCFTTTSTTPRTLSTTPIINAMVASKYNYLMCCM